MFLYLESPKEDQFPNIVCKLNQKFPPHSKVCVPFNALYPHPSWDYFNSSIIVCRTERSSHFAVTMQSYWHRRMKPTATWPMFGCPIVKQPLQFSSTTPKPWLATSPTPSLIRYSRIWVGLTNTHFFDASSKVVFIHQVGARQHGLFVQAVRKMQTKFSRVVLSVLADAKEELTEAKLIQIADAMESH